MPRLFAAVLLCCLTLSAQAAFTLPGDAMRCTRSATLLNCSDRFGNHYGMRQQGSDTLMRGFDVISGLSWAQTSTTYGRLQIFTGVSADGEVWFGSSRRIGWNVVSRLSSSQGERDRVNCNRLNGCR
ncbi:hypothetical protein Pstr01_30440 [Pseudomonas straminea]|uniref:Glutamine synthetase n=1 Tax=Pseudomonas straminea TaxID=47882 RepID=A0A1I1WE46_PSEOC|nr:hypothetical protein [Pseudomonas straminea]GLX14805.1 hypothetical protein Pstr01_30440 [Pseudomonas straminea]SFD93446.1 hypothetical protein SAMN05216372_105442 [Pseudomonas straminea]